ncbi:phosphocholine-specific phospholipase C [Caballeronia grimmiae]|uniref:phosphocholine-specific phospholipase C n=1 Tax=Caballeronia grimmiae TaxID=1071679 RepID=UPI0038B8E798
MAATTRRQFLRTMSACAGALLAPPAPPIRAALTLPATGRTGTIRDVGHVVILMQENRSFDHYFGTLGGVRGFEDPRPLILANGRPVWYQPGASVFTSEYQSRGLPNHAPYVLPFHLDSKATTEFTPGTDHSWSTGHLAWNEGRYDAWVNQKQDPLTMAFLRREDLAYHYALADAFTVCDAYFCSVHADTAPNRLMLFSGTMDTRNRLGPLRTGPGFSERDAGDPYSWTTYPERLESAGIEWKVYQGGTGLPGDATDNYTNNSLEFFQRFQAAHNAPASLVQKGASRHTLLEFQRDVDENRLPAVSWVIAPKIYCEHPNGCPADGAFYINRILEALTSNPAVWGRAVLFINYDENDGFFDHVVPPMPPLTSAQGNAGLVSRKLVDSLGDEFVDLDEYPRHKRPLIPNADPGGRQPIGLGPRVPMIVVSPWTKGGWVCSQVFDHTSVLQFLEARFGVAEPNISAWRRAVCGDLTSAFDFTVNPDTAKGPFGPVARVGSRGAAIAIPDPQAMPGCERTTRPARALPYALAMNGRIADDLFLLDFRNGSRVGVAFYIYDRVRARSAPRRYTMAAGDAFSDFWPLRDSQGRYDLSVYGPNGSLFEFRGSAEGNALPEVQLSLDPGALLAALRVTNGGRVACRLRVANAYDTASAREVSVSPGETLMDRWDVSGRSGWYDLSVSSVDFDGFARRYAGHVETGAPSMSDPGPV